MEVIKNIGLGNKLIYNEDTNITKLIIEDLDIMYVYDINKDTVNWIVGDMEGENNYIDNLVYFFENDFHVSFSSKEINLNSI